MQKFADDGLQTLALRRKRRPAAKYRKLDSRPGRLRGPGLLPDPDGLARSAAIRLLADYLVELDVVAAVSDDGAAYAQIIRGQAVAEATVGAAAEGGSAGFVAAMGDVLDVYTQPYDGGGRWRASTRAANS